MAAKAKEATAPLYLIAGEDDFSVKQRARQLYDKLCQEVGGLDHEIVDGAAANTQEALNSLGKLREALLTLPFFGGGKVVWFQNCAFLGDERAASTNAVTEALAKLAELLKTFEWRGVQLMISAGKVDKRKTFYKTLEKLGNVEFFASWAEDKDWATTAEMTARQLLKDFKKEIAYDALARLVADVGPNRRQLVSEVEKVALYCGARVKIVLEDVEAVVTKNKQAKAFALADALGQRKLPQLLKTLDEQLWALKLDKNASEIGLLYGLISKVRVMLFLKEMAREKWIDPHADFSGFKAALNRIPPDLMPQDPKFNPLAMHPWMLHNSLNHSRNYTTEELVRAMETLLQCNQDLIFSGLDEAMALQQTVLKIAQPRKAA